jgi:hypothetical protein
MNDQGKASHKAPKLGSGNAPKGFSVALVGPAPKPSVKEQQ